MNQLTIVGTVGKDPELRFSNNGLPIASLSVATNYGKDEKKTTTWHYVTVFGDMAEHVAASIHKGTRLIVVGRLDKSQYEKDGVTRENVSIIADHVGIELRFGAVSNEPDNF
jgi:single-strand DNA-binding protein